MLIALVWLQQQKHIYRLRNVRAGYVLYRALVSFVFGKCSCCPMCSAWERGSWSWLEVKYVVSDYDDSPPIYEHNNN